MGLIINRLKQLLKGYPTVSDKYNVAGGTYEGATLLEVGEVVAYGSATGYYVAFMDGAKTAASVAGISMAKNVKLINKYPANGETVKIEKGEAIDLFVDGYIAIELADADVYKAVATPSEDDFNAGKYYVVDTDGNYVPATGTYDSTASYFEVKITITEGTEAYIDVATGKFTATSTNNIAYGKFTGITEYNYGKYLAEIVVK